MNEQLSTFLQTNMGAWTLSIVVIWSLIWKGIALWKAAQRGRKAWYIVLLILNTLGILEIIYVFLIANKQKER
jgi:hypothetical protein